MDSHFDTTPHNGHCQAVFTYLTSGYVDPSTFNISAFGGGTAQGENLWLSNVTVPAGSSFLAAVHIGLITKVSPTTLPINGSFDGFAANLVLAGTDPNSLAPVILDSMATPNPAVTPISFTIK